MKLLLFFHTHILMHTHTHALMYTCTHTHACMHAHTCKHMHASTCIYAHKHICTQTQNNVNFHIRLTKMLTSFSIFLQTSRLYDIGTNNQRTCFKQNSPVLDCCFTDSIHGYAGGIDGRLKWYIFFLIILCNPYARLLLLLW